MCPKRKKWSLILGKKILAIAGEVIEEVKSFKFVGTTISSDLKWDENQESPPATFLPEIAKEIQSQSFHTDSFLPRCNWERSDIFYHCLVQQRVSEKQKSTREDSPKGL